MDPSSSASAHSSADTLVLNMPGVGDGYHWDVDSAARECVRACKEGLEKRQQMSIVLVPLHADDTQQAAIKKALERELLKIQY
jgi:hypothetical protein